MALSRPCSTSDTCCTQRSKLPGKHTAVQQSLWPECHETAIAPIAPGSGLWQEHASGQAGWQLMRGRLQGGASFPAMLQHLQVHGHSIRCSGIAIQHWSSSAYCATASGVSMGWGMMTPAYAHICLQQEWSTMFTGAHGAACMMCMPLLERFDLGCPWNLESTVKDAIIG